MAAKTLVLLAVVAATAVTGTSSLENAAGVRATAGAAAAVPGSTANPTAATPVGAAPLGTASVASTAGSERDLLHPTGQGPSAVGSPTVSRTASPARGSAPAARPSTPTTARTPSTQPSGRRPSATPTRPASRRRPASTQRPAASTGQTGSRTSSTTVTGPTGWPALNAAIRRIPGYRSSGITWTVSSRYGHWGATDMATGRIYISPSVSPGVLDSVVRHEYAHIVTVRDYAGDWRTAKQAANATFGGTGRTGVERAADCMARALGASFTQYTSCGRSDWQAAAGRLLSGRRL